MKNLVLVTALGLALTACSGGGSGSDSGTPETKTPVTQTASLDFVRDDLKEQVKTLKQIVVNGVKVDLSSEGIGFVERDLGNGLKGKVYNLAYSAIGYALPNNVKTDGYGRVVDGRVSVNDTSELGLTTKFAELPKEGVITYTGVSFGANSQGKLTLKADFGNTKQISGAITERTLLSNGNKLFDIDLQSADIKQYMRGSDEIHFIGEAKSNVDGYVITAPYAGKFMGPEAEEVVGYVFDDQNNPYEGFAGKK